MGHPCVKITLPVLIFFLSVLPYGGSFLMTNANHSRVLRDLVDTGESGEHIFISSTEERSDIVHRTTNCELEQNNRLKGILTTFRIFNRHHMSVRTKATRGGERGFHFHLAFLDAKPKKRKRIACRTLMWAALLAGILSLVLWLDQNSAWPLKTRFWLPATATMAAATVIALLLAVYRSRDRYVFFTRHGRIPLVFIDSRNPNRGEVEEFMEELSDRIKQATQDMWHDKRQYLCEELREHTRLKTEGIIPPRIFEGAKARILQQHE